MIKLVSAKEARKQAEVHRKQLSRGQHELVYRRIEEATKLGHTYCHFSYHEIEFIWEVAITELRALGYRVEISQIMMATVTSPANRKATVSWLEG